MPIKINEIYKTIQGESTFAGLPCIMARFTGCNLRCAYCDTSHAYEKGTSLTIKKAFQKIETYTCRYVCITGGEPLMQEDLYPLTEMLMQNGYQVLIETNGSIAINRLHDNIIRIMDIKCPDSTMSHTTLLKNIEYIKKTDEVKFVLSSEKDYRWANGIIAKYSLDSRCSVLFSPVVERIQPSQLAGWMLRDNLNVRLQLQLHKVIGVR